MTSIDEQFIEFIVKSLVGNPDEVKIDRTIDEKGVLLELTVDPEDLGRVIGKRGATAQSMRTLLRALGTKNDARYNLKIIDNGVAPPPRRDNREDEAPAASRDGNSDDKANKDDKKEDKPAENAPEAIEEPEVKEEPAEEKESLTERTRKELSDLDDLDI